MRHLKTFLLALAIIAISASSSVAEALEVASAPASVTAQRGQPVAMAVSMKNTLTPRDPITITAEAQWEDEYGEAKIATASTTINVVQPVKISRYKVAIPALFAFVAGSAKVNGQSVIPILDSGQLIIDLGRTLLEGESVALEYSLKAH